MSDELEVSRYSWSKRGMRHEPIGFGGMFVDYGCYKDLHDQLLASREEVARLREVENAARGFLDDFDNGNDLVCADGMYHIDKLRAALPASLAPAKTCRWTLADNEDGVDYNTSCGQEALGDYQIAELSYKFCPYCGLPIEEVKEETT